VRGGVQIQIREGLRPLDVLRAEDAAREALDATQVAAGMRASAW